MSIVKLLLADQIEALSALEGELRSAPDVGSAFHRLVARTAAILETPTMLLERRGQQWRTTTESSVRPASGDEIRAGQVTELAPEALGCRVIDVIIDSVRWTGALLSSETDAALLLLLQDDWTTVEKTLERIVSPWAAALVADKPMREAMADRQLRMVLRAARRLARTSDPSRVYSIIAESAARVVGAQSSSVAMYDPEHEWLTIQATYGYSSVLVRHLRLRPGTGIVGRVFRSGLPLQTLDARHQRLGVKHRLRYRSTSFMAYPLVGSEGVIGVISVADKTDGFEFGRADFRTLRALASVATLALDRVLAAERATVQTHMAAIDEATGLFNRRHFRSRLEEEAERSRRHSSPLSLMLLDIDDFKGLNDRYGHLTGDAALRLVGEVLRQSVRLFDVCARTGGDEFAVLMPGSGGDSSLQIAERIRTTIEEGRVSGGSGGERVTVTVSIGIATLADTSTEVLIDRADQALYAAKRGGKNRIQTGDLS